MSKAKALMVVGTSSFAGKSLITAALCRIFRNKGFSVAPFKAQNMSLNSTVTSMGREISRSQALQAFASGIEPTHIMNPILLKPMGNGMSQVVLNGLPWGDISSEDYYNSFVPEIGWMEVKKALESLSQEYEIIVIEGAGSPAEINLYQRDIANLAVAEHASAEVILVSDIERGGVFASIFGTLKLMKPEHQKLVKGVIINKFRGAEKILEPGVKEIEELVGVPVIGIVPFLDGLRLPEEDSQGIDQNRGKRVDIVVVRLPRISNFTDFDTLTYDPRVSLRYISDSKEIGHPDAIIVPGTKSTLDDLAWLKERGFEKIKEFKGKIPIIGICGGYQILGNQIFDDGVEKDEPAVYEGLGLLDVDTYYREYVKTTAPVEGIVTADKGVFKGMSGTQINGYEIHMGVTKIMKGASPVFKLNGRFDGAADADFMTFGTYIHGLFDKPRFREHFIKFVLEKSNPSPSSAGLNVSDMWEEDMERVATSVEKSIDLSWFYG
jgi:adenosylcobyric acid synthase